MLCALSPLALHHRYQIPGIHLLSAVSDLTKKNLTLNPSSLTPKVVAVLKTPRKVGGNPFSSPFPARESLEQCSAFQVPVACCAQASNKMASLDYKEDARDLHAFKELRFFLSHAVSLEIRCSVSRLELPLVADYLLGARIGAQGNRRQHQRQGLLAENGDVGASSGGEDSGNGMDAIVRRIVSEPELVATCQIFSDGQPMHAVSMR